MTLNRTAGSTEFSLSTKPERNGGRVVGIIICLPVKTISTKGKIERMVIPFKAAEIAVASKATQKIPSCGLKNFSSFK